MRAYNVVILNNVYKCDDEDSTCIRKGKANRRWWKAGASMETGNITFEHPEPKATSSFGRDSFVMGNHIIPCF